MDSKILAAATGANLRARRPAETLQLANRLTATLGITDAVAANDDALGVPVWFSGRPGGIVTTVHAGKGMTAIDAQVGATMEAIEYAVAESDASRSAGETWSLGDLVGQFTPALTIAQFAPILTAPATDDRLVLADVCEDVRAGLRYRLPAELVRLPAPAPLSGQWLFGWSSNGLASGNSLAEATLHALLEVFERDCVAMDFVEPSMLWVSPESLPEQLSRWARQWSEIDIALHVRYLPNEFGLPCFEAFIVDRGANPVRAACGWGLHPNRQVAVSRAVTEAAQSRLHVDRDRSAALHPVAVSPPLDNDPRRRWIALSDIPELSCDGIEETTTQLLSLLHEAGMPWVLRRVMGDHPAAPDLGGLSVVKVIVPGSESAIGKDVRMGGRLASRLMRSVGA